MSRLIIQSESNDASTDDVLDWLYYFDNHLDVLRINGNAFINKVTYRLDQNGQETIKIGLEDDKLIDSQKCSGFWYRRGKFSFPKFMIKNRSSNIKFSEELNPKLRANILNEDVQIQNIVNSVFESNNSKTINSYRENFTNKLLNLSRAATAGLKVPDTLVTNDKDALLEFTRKHNDIITKDILFDPINIKLNNDDQFTISPRVQILSVNDVEMLMDKYSDSTNSIYAFYQRYIPKKYEIRIFYLYEVFFSMAIFSQANEKTRIDFRNHDSNRPNRSVPYILPKKIENKLSQFMQSIEMNCGSIDMILTPDNDYVFLEVNPVGEYRWLEKYCNYPISKLIAETLLTKKL